MSGENGSFVHSGIRQEAISGFGVGPILAGKRNTFSEPGRELLQELLQSLTQPLVRKGAASYFLFEPLGGRSEEHTSELQSRQYLVCRLLLEKKKRHTRKYK